MEGRARTGECAPRVHLREHRGTLECTLRAL
jgi:hypothetical protein